MTSSADGLEPRQASAPVVLIGGLAPKAGGAVHLVTTQFLDGLKGRVRFIPFAIDRTAGLGGRAHLNPTNVWYLVTHLASWIARLWGDRPAIAHYPVTSGWNFPKSVLFLWLGQRFGARSVGHIHGGSMDMFWEHLPAWQKKWYRRVLARQNAMIVLSERWRKWALTEWKLPETNVHIVYNPIESWFETEALTFEPAPNSRALFLGSIGKRKGVHDIVSLAAILREEGPQTKISLVGPQEWSGDLAAIKDRIRTEHLTDVELCPPVSGPAKLAAFREHGVFLFPSYRENLPLVVLEAAAAARAIITTRVGGVPEFFVHNESVIFVEPGNVRQMQEAIRRLHEDPALRRRIALAARDVFRSRLVRTSIMDSLAAVYRDVLATTRSRGTEARRHAS